MAFLAPIGAALTSAAPTLKLIGTGIGAVSGFISNRYQASLASRQAAILRQEANVQTEAAATEAQDADQVAAQEMAMQEAQQASSGFSTGSMSFRRRKKMTSLLARRDAFRLVDAGNKRAWGLQTEAAAKDAESDSFKTASLFSIGEGMFDMSTGLIENSELVSRKKAAQLRRKATRV